VRGLGKWDSAIQKTQSSRPESRRNKSSQKSQLSDESSLSNSQESAVVHSTQISLFDFGDEIKQGDDDLAVEKTVEDLTATGDDSPDTMQKKKAWTVGGIQSE